MLWRCIG